MPTTWAPCPANNNAVLLINAGALNTKAHRVESTDFEAMRRDVEVLTADAADFTDKKYRDPNIREASWTAVVLYRFFATVSVKSCDYFYPAGVREAPG
jgi:hypothetical protein